MRPREQDELEFEDDVGVGHVEIVLEVCRRKESGKLQRHKKKFRKTGKKRHRGLHFVACIPGLLQRRCGRVACPVVRWWHRFPRQGDLLLLSGKEGCRVVD